MCYDGSLSCLPRRGVKRGRLARQLGSVGVGILGKAEDDDCTGEELYTDAWRT